MDRIKVKFYAIITMFAMIPSMYLGYNVYQSHIFQRQLLSEFNTQKYTSELTRQFYKINFDIPNITVFTIPIKQLVARYYFLAEDFDKALNLIEEGEEANPYFMFGASLKSEIYDYLGVQDSAYYYANRAFRKMPNNSRHYMFYLKSIAKRNDLKTVHESYNIIKRYPSNKQLPHLLLSTMVSMNDSTKLGIEIAENLKSLYNDPTTKLAADYVIYGYENVKESIRLSDLGQQAFAAEQFSVAANYYSEAARYYPNDYAHYENAGMSYVNSKRYIKAIPSLKKAIMLNKNNVGKSTYFLGISYHQLGKKDSACYYLRKSAKLNFRSSFKALSEYCK